MKEPTMEEVLQLVSFERDDAGNLCVENVMGNVWGSVRGSVGDVMGNVWGSVRGSVGDVVGNVWGDVGGGVGGTIKGQHWQFFQAEGGEE